MPDQATYTDALNYIIGCIERAADGSLLTDALTRLAVLSANRPDNQAKFDHFEREFRLERGRLRLLAAIPLARRIDGGSPSGDPHPFG